LIVRRDGQTYLLDDVSLGGAQLAYVEVVETATEPVELIAA
jgi:hypothetical protein